MCHVHIYIIFKDARYLRYQIVHTITEIIYNYHFSCDALCLHCFSFAHVPVAACTLLAASDDAVQVPAVFDPTVYVAAPSDTIIKSQILFNIRNITMCSLALKKNHTKF